MTRIAATRTQPIPSTSGIQAGEPHTRPAVGDDGSAGSGGIWRCSDKSLTLDDPLSASGTRGEDRFDGRRVVAAATTVHARVMGGGCSHDQWFVRVVAFPY